MRVWLICFLLFFGAAEFYEWMQGLSLPMPAMAAAGVLLAIASNYGKTVRLPWYSSERSPLRSHEQPQTSPSFAVAPVTPAASTAPRPEPQLPVFQAPAQSRSISFTIRQSEPPQGTEPGQR